MVSRGLLANALSGRASPGASHRSARHLRSPRGWLPPGGKKGGLGIDSAGHKPQKGEKARTSVANHGCVIGPLSVKPSQHQDPGMRPEPLTALVDCTAQSGIARAGAASTRAAGFDAQTHKDLSKAHPRQPGISPQRRHAKTPSALARMCRGLARRLSRLRSTVERTFGWHETFRTLVMRSDRLPESRKGCRLFASSMIHLRTTFNTS